MNDERFVASRLGIRIGDGDDVGLEARDRALVRIAALMSLDASPSSYLWAIGEAIDAGCDRREIVGVLLAIAPVVGVARVVAVAPQLSLALGYDVEAALETYDVGPDGRP
jgi:alkylhydroperoxidase/carboxymuconolactone decarboxylase family protein YurZ